MDVQYENLIMVIFNEEQLRGYKEKYYSSRHITILDIANEMKAEARAVINSFDFIDFAETVMRQTDSTIPQKIEHQEEKDIVQRL